MNIQLSPQIEGYIASKIASGAFADVSSFVSVAVAKFQSDEQRLEEFSRAMEIGEEQIERGESVAYTSELLEEITKEALKNYHSGKQPSPDVCL